MLIDHMAEGLSFETFGRKIGVVFKTLYNWTKKHPEFLQAKEEGEKAAMDFFEKVGRSGMLGSKKIDFRFWQLFMKVRFAKYGWNPDKYNITFQESNSGFKFVDDEEDANSV